MRQVLKDRLDRIDMEIAFQQFRYKEQYAKEKEAGAKVLIGGTKAIEQQIQKLIEKKEALMDKYLHEKVGSDKYIRGLADRKFNYESAVEEQEEFSRQLLEILESDSSRIEEIKYLRDKITGLNRLIAIYKKTLEMWIAKATQIREKGEVPVKYRQMNTKTNEEIGDESSTKLSLVEADPQVLAILNTPKNADGTYQRPSTNTSLETLMRFNNLRENNPEGITPEEFESRKRVVIDFED